MYLCFLQSRLVIFSVMLGWLWFRCRDFLKYFLVWVGFFICSEIRLRFLKICECLGQRVFWLVFRRCWQVFLQCFCLQRKLLQLFSIWVLWLLLVSVLWYFLLVSLGFILVWNIIVSVVCVLVLEGLILRVLCSGILVCLVFFCWRQLRLSWIQVLCVLLWFLLVFRGF